MKIKNNIINTILAALLLFTLTGCSKTGAVKRDSVAASKSGGGRDIMKYELDNGLSVILKENHQANVVAFHMWVKVGSADETDEISGISHVYEHMLFKGTKKRGVGEIASAVEGAGGDINAFTSLDQTVYHITMASEFFDTGLDIMADAIQNSSFEPEELKKEQEVIVEEIKRSLDMPGRKLNKEFFSTIYKVHTYGRPVIGTPETVRALTRERIVNYFQDWYRPNNMTLVIVGDFETEDAKKKISKLFKDFPRGEKQKSEQPVEPDQNEFRFVSFKDETSEAHMDFGYHIPSVRHEDTAALDVLALILGQGESSRLYSKIKSKESLVHSIYSYAFTPKKPGVMMIGTMLLEKNIDATVTATITEIERIKYEPVTKEELQKAKMNLESDFIYEKETVQGQARKLGYFDTSLGDHLFEKKYLKNITAVTREDIRRVASKYLNKENLTIALLLPNKSELEPTRDDFLKVVTAAAEKAKADNPITKIEPETAPEAAESSDSDDDNGGSSVSKLTRLELDNGIRILVKENHANPTFAIRTIFLGGVRYEDETNNGINNFISGMLTKGTHMRSGDDIVTEIESMAGSLDGYSGKNSIGTSGTFLSKYLNEAFEITADVTLNPKFDETEIKKRKEHVIASIKRQEDEMTGLVFNLFKKTLYQKNPYRFNILGTKETVESFSQDSLKTYHQNLFAPENLVISVAGDVDTGEIKALVEKYYGGMRKGGFTAPEVPQETGQPEKREAYIEKDKEQTHIVLGFLGVTVRDDDRVPLEVLGTVLARQGGRLFYELRDKLSLAYSVTAFSQEGYDRGSFILYIATSPEKRETAIKGLLTELEKIINEKVPEDELTMSKNYLIGNHEISLQRNSAQVASIGFDEIYGVGYDSYKDYAKDVTAVTADDITRVAKKYLNLDKYTLTAVGRGVGQGDAK